MNTLKVDRTSCNLEVDKIPNVLIMTLIIFLTFSCCGKYRAEEIDGHGKCSEDEVRNVSGCGTWLYPALSHPVDELFSFRCLYIMFVASYLCQLPSFVLAFVLNRKILTQFKV